MANVNVNEKENGAVQAFNQDNNVEETKTSTTPEEVARTEKVKLWRTSRFSCQKALDLVALSLDDMYYGAQLSSARKRSSYEIEHLKAVKELAEEARELVTDLKLTVNENAPDSEVFKAVHKECEAHLKNHCLWGE